MFDRRNVLRGAAALGLGGVFMGGVAWSQERAKVRALLPSASADTLAVDEIIHLMGLGHAGSVVVVMRERNRREGKLRRMI